MLRRGSTKSKGKGKGKGAREALRDLSSGEGGLQLRCAPMGADAAAAAVAAVKIWSGEGSASEDAAAVGRKAGKARPMSKPSNKLIVAGDYSKAGKAAAAAPAAKVAGGVTEGDKHAADVTPASAAEADDTSGGNQEGVRLSQSLVNYILGMKPEVVEDADEYYARMTSDPTKKHFSQEYIDSTTAMLRDLADSSKRIFARFEKFQAWARAEYNEKGYVEVDDDYIAQRVLLREAMGAVEDEEAFTPTEGLEYADE